MIEGLDIPIRFGDPGDGAQQATEDLDRLRSAQERAARSAVEMTGRAAAAASQISAFGRVIRSEAVEQLGTLIQRSAQSAQQFSALGLALGPEGALVGGIVGALLPALADTIAAFDETAESERALSEQLRRNQRTLDDYVESARRLASALSREQRLLAGLGETQEQEAAIQREQENRRTLTARLADAQRRLADAQGANSFFDDRTAEIRRTRDEINELQGLIESSDSFLENYRAQARRAAEETEALLLEDLTAAAQGPGGGEPPERRGGRRREVSSAEDDAREYERFRALIGDINQEADRDEARRTADRLRAKQEEYSQLLEMKRKQLEEEAELEREAAREREDRERQEQRRAEQAMQRREDDWNRLFEVGTQVVDTLSTAIADVVLGTKSADEAFLGLLKSFLEMISQQATLSAGKEFAEAAAAFARYDYGGGAAHIGAGVAFTAVAVATGIGAAAIQPPQAAQPAEPVRSEGSSERGGDTVVNFNSPVVTSGTRAELGREIRGLVDSADARYG